MKFLNKTMVKLYGKRRVMYASFLCPFCYNIIEKPLKDGKKCQSCGCSTYLISALKATRHGCYKDNLYGVWLAMKSRCYQKNNSRYKTYGARGIEVCKEWKNNYIAFKTWAYENGYNKEKDKNKRNILTIDRIDNNRNYEPSNCRWINATDNSRKTTTTTPIETIKQIKKLLKETTYSRNYISRICGVSYYVVQDIALNRAWKGVE